ncbi:MAG: hypothetical protein Q8J69_11440 [Sphingobacteriaceae bacterium]|nr:hypothetical protein [Sphingobacteriaceae bacterium]
MKAFWVFCLLCLPVFALAQPKNAPKDDIIEFQINSFYSPEELDALIQKLNKRGVQLVFTETGYCNGQLRILRGEIIGNDGSRVKFETRALKQLTVKLKAQTKVLGIQGINIKNRWKKCREADEEEEVIELELPETRPIHQI